MSKSWGDMIWKHWNKKAYLEVFQQETWMCRIFQFLSASNTWGGKMRTGLANASQSFARYVWSPLSWILKALKTVFAYTDCILGPSHGSEKCLDKTLYSYNRLHILRRGKFDKIFPSIFTFYILLSRYEGGSLLCAINTVEVGEWSDIDASLQDLSSLFVFTQKQLYDRHWVIDKSIQMHFESIFYLKSHFCITFGFALSSSIWNWKEWCDVVLQNQWEHYQESYEKAFQAHLKILLLGF